jgi:hypothetical protein
MHGLVISRKNLSVLFASRKGRQGSSGNEVVDYEHNPKMRLRQEKICQPPEGACHWFSIPIFAVQKI